MYSKQYGLDVMSINHRFVLVRICKSEDLCLRLIAVECWHSQFCDVTHIFEELMLQIKWCIYSPARYSEDLWATQIASSTSQREWMWCLDPSRSRISCNKSSSTTFTWLPLHSLHPLLPSLSPFVPLPQAFFGGASMIAGAGDAGISSADNLGTSSPA